MIVEQAVRLFGKTLNVDVTKYHIGQNALVLCSVDGYPGDYGHASVAIPSAPQHLMATYLRHSGFDVAENVVYIKGWEFPDQPILEQLVEAGIVQDTGLAVPCGRCMADVALINVAYLPRVS